MSRLNFVNFKLISHQSFSRKGNGVIHIWLANSHLTSQNNALRVWQPTTQTWLPTENWQEVATLATLQNGTKSAQKSFGSSANAVCLYFPSIHLLKTQPNLSANQLKALGETGRRYLFEDISIGNVEDLQVKADIAPKPSLYAIHQNDREQWENAVSLAGLTLVALLPDFLLLPTEVLVRDNGGIDESGTQSALYYQDTATQLLAFTQDNNQSAGLAVSHLPMLLSTIPQLQNLWLIQDNGINPQQFANFPQLTIHTTEALPRPVAEPTRALLNFAVKKAESHVPAYAKIIGLVLLMAVIFAIIVDGLRWYYYQKALEQTNAALAMQYNQWFPNEKFNPQLAIQRQIQTKLIHDQDGDNKVLSALSSIQPILQQNQITTTSLNYQGQMLQLNVTATNTETLNKAVSQLAAGGLNVKLGSISGNNISTIVSPTVATTQTGTASSPVPMSNALANASKPSTASSNATIQVAL